MKKVSTKKTHKRSLHKKVANNRFSKGNSSLIFLVGVVALSLLLVAGFGSYLPDTYNSRVHLTPVPPPPATSHNTLQLNPLTFIATTDTPAPTSAPAALCQNDTVNDEPEIIVGYLPSTGQTVTTGGQIKIWINDEGRPIIAPNEILDPITGIPTTQGDRTAKAPDGYFWEPALYIAPQTAESGGTPHFPNVIKGDYNSTGSNSYGNRGAGSHVGGMDPVPGNPNLGEPFTAEDIWDVNSLGLAPGNYQAEFLIHDGDKERGIGCVNIIIQ